MVVPKIKIDGIIQIGIVVRDIQKVADNYWTTFGIGPWQIVRMEPPILREVTLRGKPVETSMLAAIAQSGSLQLELIQPLEGPSIWKEFLEEKEKAFIMSRHMNRTLKRCSPGLRKWELKR